MGIEVGECSCTMTGTKVEMKMKKAEPGSWSRLDIPRPVTKTVEKEPEKKVEDSVDPLDLDDLDFSISKPTLSAVHQLGERMPKSSKAIIRSSQNHFVKETVLALGNPFSD